MYSYPFEKYDEVLILLPTKLDHLSDVDLKNISKFSKLIEEHKSKIEVELGSKVTFDITKIANSSIGKWYIGPYNCSPEIVELGLKYPNNPQLFLDREKGILVTHGPTVSEVVETFSYLRSLCTFKGGLWDINDCNTTQMAIDVIEKEVENSYPSFQLRKLNWKSLCEKHIPMVLKSIDPIPPIQRWLAELNDAHTWVRPYPPLGELPYDLHVKNNIGTFYQVPKSSIAWKE